MHQVAVVAVPPATSFDLAIPELVLCMTSIDGRPGYEVRICTAHPGPVASYSSAEIIVQHGLDVLDDADTVIVTGTGARDDIDPSVLAALRRAAAAGKRVASICTGAFVLAEAGLLDGRAATTYWARAAEFVRRFPAVKLRPDVLFVEDRNVVTSAGLGAGIDLCLHLVRTDYGAGTANAVARLVVAAPVRAADQPQLIRSPVPPETGTSLAATRVWALQRLHEPLTRAALATHASISIRTLTRRFHAETGLSPLQWLLHQRLTRAQELLEITDLPLDQVARLSGLATTDSLRRHMTRRTGLTPSAYRTARITAPKTGPDIGSAAGQEG
jgi:transcriptional regulator GlxA family with amidase domain